MVKGILQLRKRYLVLYTRSHKIGTPHTSGHSIATIVMSSRYCCLDWPMFTVSLAGVLTVNLFSLLLFVIAVLCFQ